MSNAELIRRLREDAAAEYSRARSPRPGAWTHEYTAGPLTEAADALEAAAKRTAEDERRDVLLKLDALAAEKAAHGFTASGTVATARRDANVSALRMAYEVIERGDHVGPTVESTRITSDAPAAPQEAGPRLPHLSEVRRPAVTSNVRTAEDERRDVLAFLHAEVFKFIGAAREFKTDGAIDSADRCDVRAALARTYFAYFTRGDHEGAAGR